MKFIDMLRTERAALSLKRGARTARLGYFAAGDRALEAHARLEGHGAQHATTRARLLSALSARETEMSVLVKGCQWNEEEDATVSAEHEATGTLLFLLASTESAHGVYNRARGPQHWEEAFGAILDDLTGETDLGHRAELMTRLYIAVHPVIGPAAAETLAVLRNSYAALALDQNATDRERTAAVAEPLTPYEQDMVDLHRFHDDIEAADQAEYAEFMDELDARDAARTTGQEGPA